MRRASAVLAIAALAIVSCGGAGNHQSQAAACKHAIEKQVKAALHGDRHKNSKPAACNGLPARVMKRISREVIAHEFGKG